MCKTRGSFVVLLNTHYISTNNKQTNKQTPLHTPLSTDKGKGKAITAQARTGHEGSRRLKPPDFKIIGT